VIKTFSDLARCGLDLLVPVVLKYRQVQLDPTDVVLMQQVGIQVKCQMHWMQLQMEQFALNGNLILAIGTRTRL
jgi:hypothetical protein